MNRLSIINKTSCRKIPILVFALVIWGAIFATHSVQAAVPLAVPTAVILDSSPTSITRTKTDIAKNAKDYWLDKAATIAAKQMLHQMTADVVGWINSGFKGSPAFLTNPEGFFMDTADYVSGNFLAQSGPLKNLCSPWNVDIRLALALQQAGTGVGGINRGRYACTLSTLIDNARNASVNGQSIRGFLNGDFNQGGWSAFIALSTDPRNNPYSLYLTAYSDQLAAIGEKKAHISQDLLQGAGFMSWEDCKPATNITAADPDFAEYADPSLSRDKNGVLQRCVKKTPGSVIAGTLMPQLNNGRDELQLADSINSVLNALVGQLLTQTLRKGLYSASSGGSGISGRTGGTNASLLSQVISDATTARTVSTGAGTDIAGLTQIKNIYATAVTNLTPVKASLIAVRACFSGKFASLPADKQAIATGEIASIDADLTVVNPLLSSLTSTRDNLVAQITAASTPVTVGGTTNFETLANAGTNLTEQFINTSNANSNFTVPTLTEAQAVELDVASKITNLNGTIPSYQSSCNSL